MQSNQKWGNLLMNMANTFQTRESKVTALTRDNMKILIKRKKLCIIFSVIINNVTFKSRIATDNFKHILENFESHGWTAVIDDSSDKILQTVAQFMNTFQDLKASDTNNTRKPTESKEKYCPMSGFTSTSVHCHKPTCNESSCSVPSAETTSPPACPLGNNNYRQCPAFARCPLSRCPVFSGNDTCFTNTCPFKSETTSEEREDRSPVDISVDIKCTSTGIDSSNTDRKQNVPNVDLINKLMSIAMSSSNSNKDDPSNIGIDKLIETIKKSTLANSQEKKETVDDSIDTFMSLLNSFK